MAYYIPSVVYIYPQGLGTLEVTRTVPRPATAMFQIELDFPARGMHHLHKAYYCGGVGFLDPSGDGFFVISGFSDLDKLINAPVYDRGWWASSRFPPVCRVHRRTTLRPSQDSLGDLAGSDSGWLRQILKLGDAEDDSSDGSADIQPSHDVLHGETRRSCVNSTGLLVSVTAILRRVEFCGRRRCEVEIDIDIKPTA